MQDNKPRFWSHFLIQQKSVWVPSFLQKSVKLQRICKPIILDDDLTPQWSEGPKGPPFAILKLKILHAVNVTMQTANTHACSLILNLKFIKRVIAIIRGRSWLVCSNWNGRHVFCVFHTLAIGRWPANGEDATILWCNYMWVVTYTFCTQSVTLPRHWPTECSSTQLTQFMLLDICASCSPTPTLAWPLSLHSHLQNSKVHHRPS